MIDLYIDNNVWDLLFDLGLDLCAELPPSEFRILITREWEMEIAPIPDRNAGLRAFSEATIACCCATVRRPAARHRAAAPFRSAVRPAPA